MQQYSTVKAIVNKVRPGTFAQNGYGEYFSSGVSGLGRALGAGAGISFSTNMMIGMAIGAIGTVYFTKHKKKGK